MRTPGFGAMLLLSVGALGGGVASAGTDGVPRLLLDRDLNTREVMLTGLNGDWVTWIDAAERERREPTSGLIAIVAEGGGLLPQSVRDQMARSLNFPIVETTDGQRVSARVLPDRERDEEHVELMLVGGATLRVRVEQIASLTMPQEDPGRVRATESIDDIIVLSNGDVLEGFVSRLGPEIEIELETGPQRVPLTQVARIDLANPTERGGGARAWLDDGSVLSCSSISTEEGVVSLTLSLGAPSPGDDVSESNRPTELRLPMSRIAGVLFDRGQTGVGVEPLSSWSPMSHEGVGGRHWAPAPIVDESGRGVLGAGSIQLPGPMRVTWDLPRGATRIAGVMTLGDRPGVWADCEVAIRVIDSRGKASELTRQRLRHDEPTSEFNVDLGPGASGRSLEIVVEEGAYGPIQDRVSLERVLLLVEE